MPPVPVVAALLADPAAVEVHVVASGDYAVVHVPGSPTLRLVRMLGAAAGSATELTLPAEPTDIDLAPGGQRIYGVNATECGNFGSQLRWMCHAKNAHHLFL